MKQISVQDFMEKKVVSVRSDTTLADAARIIAQGGFDGVPVVDEKNTLEGVLTEYDLISKGSAIHFPTFQKILEHLPVFSKDQNKFQSEIAEVTRMTVKDVMNAEPLVLRRDATYEDAVTAFRDHHRVNPIPVIDENRKVIGVVSRYDVLKPLQVIASQSAEQDID